MPPILVENARNVVYSHMLLDLSGQSCHSQTHNIPIGFSHPPLWLTVFIETGLGVPLSHGRFDCITHSLTHIRSELKSTFVVVGKYRVQSSCMTLTNQMHKYINTRD